MGILVYKGICSKLYINLENSYLIQNLLYILFTYITQEFDIFICTMYKNKYNKILPIISMIFKYIFHILKSYYIMTENI